MTTPMLPFPKQLPQPKYPTAPHSAGFLPVPLIRKEKCQELWLWLPAWFQDFLGVKEDGACVTGCTPPAMIRPRPFQEPRQYIVQQALLLLLCQLHSRLMPRAVKQSHYSRVSFIMYIFFTFVILTKQQSCFAPTAPPPFL